MPRRPWIQHLRHIIACALALSLLGLTALSPAPARAGTAPGDHLPDELLVGFHDDVAAEQAEAIYRAEGASRMERLHRLNIHRIQLDPAALAAMEKRLRSRPEVAFVERNRRIPIALVPNDPSYGVQWHLPRIGAPEAWDITTGSPDVVIGILDTGVDPTHPDLQAKLVPGWNFYDNNSSTADAHGHGTLVAGAAAAIGNNGIGVAGVAMASRIMPLRVSDPDGFAYYSTISNALTWAADRGAKVMNISFSGVAESRSIRDAAQYVRSRGGVVVASAGNCGCVVSTANAVEIVSVASTSKSDGVSSFSTRGAHVDVAAPGEAIHTTAQGGGYASAAGTSFSSPITAGVVALMMAANPGLSPGQIEQLLMANADDLGPAGWDSGYGFGRVNAYRAVAAASGSPAPDTTPPSVSIIRPAAGATVSGTVTVTAAASDNVGVTRVELRAAGSLVSTRTTAPWSFSWNSASLPGGSQTLTVRAHDAAGNVASASVTVRVANGSSAYSRSWGSTGPGVSPRSPAPGPTPTWPRQRNQ